MDTELTRKVRDYFLARDKIDKILEDNSAEIQRNLKIVVGYRVEIFHALMNQWSRHVEALGYPFSELVSVGPLDAALAGAYTEYIRYVFYYRFANNLPRNIIYRKIFSFEFYYFHKRHVLQRRDDAPQAPLDDLSPDARLFHLSPLAHFFAYRLLKEFRLVKIDLPEAVTLFRRVQGIVTQKVLDFVARDGSAETQHDSFRIFLNQPGNEDIRSVFDVIEDEKYPRRQPNLFEI
ncbi:MAG: hypothetical protein K1X75_16910 [Leptospirales bacterium]|nr:hypothetical protein [Leptospirales bacterium]